MIRKHMIFSVVMLLIFDVLSRIKRFIHRKKLSEYVLTTSESDFYKNFLFVLMWWFIPIANIVAIVTAAYLQALPIDRNIKLDLELGLIKPKEQNL